jgi:hypothetical protein
MDVAGMLKTYNYEVKENIRKYVGAAYRPEGLSGSTSFFREIFGSFPTLIEML